MDASILKAVVIEELLHLERCSILPLGVTIGLIEGESLVKGRWDAMTKLVSRR